MSSSHRGSGVKKGGVGVGGGIVPKFSEIQTFFLLIA